MAQSQTLPPMKFSNRYPLKPFQETDFAKLKRVILDYPLAALISQNEGFPAVSQVPLILNEAEDKLLGHFDKNNPHCQHILAGGPIYCLFNGPNHYITPSIYPNEQYPGWNYVAVHVQGMVKPIEDEQKLADILLKTAVLNEPPNSGYTLSPDQTNFHVYIKMILGFEIEILDIKGIFKLAQDKGQPHIDIAKNHLAKTAQRDVSDFLTALLS